MSSSGVFTDTHMLSLMYAGDVCKWHTLCSEAGSNAPTGNCGARGWGKDTSSRGVKPCNLQEEPDGSQSTAVHCNQDAPSPAHQGVNPCHLQQASPVAVLPLSLQPYLLMDTACGEEHSRKWVATFNAPVLCERYLTRYISVARGPLKGLGWSYERAVKLLVELRRSQQPPSDKPRSPS